MVLFKLLSLRLTKDHSSVKVGVVIDVVITFLFFWLSNWCWLTDSWVEVGV
jgi:hypothetical protein